MRAIALISLMIASTAHAYDPANPEACGERELYEDHHIDCHYQEDARRLTLIDDRGGQGVAYGFYLDPRPENPGAYDYCHNCALAVMVADPGINYDDFEFLGVSLQDIETIGDLVPVVERLLQEDPEALARELQPNLEGQDLAGLVEEVMRIKARIGPLVDKLRALERIKNLDFDFDALDDFPTLANDLGLKSDAAFRGDFDNPNDVRRNNSGVTVYTLPRFLQSMVDNNVPALLRDQAEALLSNIQGLPGLLEISGDDDNAMNPVTFHGITTDLNIEARSYVVNGTNAILQVYTVVNNTPRFLPLVQVAMITDFDMPPLSYDTSTHFDPARFAVMVYDNAPTYEPVEHFWYGSAPAPNALPGVGGFVPANWNIDKNLSLAQAAPSIHDNRLKFFTWHPDVSGDHDDAVGKSEKQGAISQMLVGPLRPNERRQVAFCRAVGKALNSNQAQVEMYAQLDACRALYALITPECGNGMLQLLEECDDGNADPGDGCAACKLEECGDGNVIGAEQCDDGNTDANDGCGPTCQIERQGDGIVQANEVCDDGNQIQTDSCLIAGTVARCGDGHLRVCNPEVEDCGCLGGAHCLVGEFTVISSRGQTEALDAALGRTVQYRFGFDIMSQAAVPGRLEVTTGPVTVELRGDAELEAMGRLMNGDPWTFTLAGDGPIEVTTTRLTGGNRDSSYSLELAGQAMRRGVGLDGLTLREASFTIQRFAPRTREPSDVAIGAGPAAIEGRGEGVGIDEACDDGNASDFDLCTTACEPARCGDGFLQVEAGEQCDAAVDWCMDCLLVEAALCGNGLLEADRGEQCDDSGNADGDGCSALCRTEVCGDGIVQADEQCDDGNPEGGDGCNPACLLEICGDGVVQGDEVCDDGDQNGDTAACLSTCRPAACGDGQVQAGVEACDDGNLVDGDGCAASCVIEVCGDGSAGPGEACDDGNAEAGDGCTACQVDFCGDGRPGPGEQCDDANPVDGDGCDKQCALENPAACGDGTPDPGEQCDDGNTSPGDGCDTTCRLENPAACGDGRLDPGEGCDDGNTIAGDGCSATCTAEGCGDTIQQPGEGCDDGNRESNDGCNTDCQIEPSECGNGVHEVGEQCDDGNQEPADGCDACTRPVDIGEINQTCGNGALETGEQCDDGDRSEGDGCDSLCQLEATVCGNGRLERGEDCDPGVAAERDGCLEDCRFGGECGNGVQEVGEGCDDGNATAGDGCDPACAQEVAPDAGLTDGGIDGGVCICPEVGPCDCPDSGDDGCGCEVEGRGSPALPLALLALGLLRRRRRG
jgi:MYXO-CTERM domain-containing protein